MAQSFATVRLGAAALFLAAGLTVACGGDDSGKDNGDDDSPATGDSGTDTEKKDGGGAGDARVIGKDDAGTDPKTDAGDDELEAAIDPAGIHFSSRRAELVYGAGCAQAEKCDLLEDGITAASCASGNLDQFGKAQAKGAPDACLDAVLDYYGCVAVPDCDNDCSEFEDAIDPACEGFMLDADDAGLIEEGDSGL